MAFAGLKWFSGKKDAEEEARRLMLEEFQNVKKLLRKQALMIKESRWEREAAAATRENSPSRPLTDLCDSVFHLHRAFQSPGIMSRQHVQVLNMVERKMERFAASLGLEMILEEGIAFDSRLHEAVANQSPGSETLEVIELIQPGYLQNGKVIRPARVIVGDPGGTAPALKGTLG